MDYRSVTLRDIERMQNEIAQYYRGRKIFMILGWLCIAISITIVIIAGLTATEDNPKTSAVVISSIIFAAGIVMFILRSALYNKRIRNRKNLISQAKQYQETVRLFNNNEGKK